MKKKSLILLVLPILFLTGCTSKSVVLLNTKVVTAEQVLNDTVNLYNPVLTFISKDPERHVYTVRYNYGTYAALPTSNLNINVNATEKMIQSATLKNEGGFSCNFREIDNNNTLATCRKISPVNVYIYNHYEKFLKELKNDNIEYVSYKKYIRMKANSKL